MCPVRTYSRPGETGLMTCSRSAKVGYVRAMSVCSTASWWFDRERIWSLKPIMTIATSVAAPRAGIITVGIPTPLAFSAVISFSESSRLKA